MDDFIKNPMSVSALLARSGSGRGGLCHTARVKTYPDGSSEVLVCDQAIFHPQGWERAGERPPRRRRAQEAPERPPEVRERDNLDRSLRRARAQVRDLALANPFRWPVCKQTRQTFENQEQLTIFGK